MNYAEKLREEPMSRFTTILVHKIGDRVVDAFGDRIGIVDSIKFTDRDMVNALYGVRWSCGESSECAVHELQKCNSKQIGFASFMEPNKSQEIRR